MTSLEILEMVKKAREAIEVLSYNLRFCVWPDDWVGEILTLSSGRKLPAAGRDFALFVLLQIWLAKIINGAWQQAWRYWKSQFQARVTKQGATAQMGMVRNSKITRGHPLLAPVNIYLEKDTPNESISLRTVVGLHSPPLAVHLPLLFKQSERACSVLTPL